MDKKARLLNLIRQIEETKVKLYDLIERNQFNLINPEVVRLSELLDRLLFEYYDIKK
ncbi:Spo0E like sporulation regulatory protein [Gottschalkia purinilytica]|uniref:Spo0E like sporulation regulatory protein n=1 Tax=Gottschalkia purinilytica TaxID=1503 RepID=A0A0L0W8H2_GOTPU|nr:aspartyl-phosphate phosphatase Spo0E family protein [Gottschalkia purinilytica]KNF07844.1 Spo0E like sporulation regulatory protein [Gottschalkia purinilytica]